MAKIIVKSSYYKPNSERSAAGFIRYISTRDGVEKIDESKKYLPAAKKTQQIIICDEHIPVAVTISRFSIVISVEKTSCYAESGVAKEWCCAAIGAAELYKVADLQTHLFHYLVFYRTLKKAFGQPSFNYLGQANPFSHRNYTGIFAFFARKQLSVYLINALRIADTV